MSYAVARPVCWGCLMIVLTAGCGSSDLPVAPAAGKVTCDGKPVAGGYITFTPIAEEQTTEPGKSAGARIGSDGAFQLSTYGNKDGAIIGKHAVAYIAAGPPGADSSSDACALPRGHMEEVVSGQNFFEIKLKPSNK